MKKFDNVIEWLEQVEPRVFYDAKVFDDLTDYGFEVETSRSGDQHYVTVRYHNRATKVSVNTWQDDFNALIRRGLPFFVIDVSHDGPPEHHEQYGTGYGVVNPNDISTDELNLLGIGYISKNEVALRQHTVSGSAIYRALADLIAIETPGDDKHGRNAAAMADLDAIKAAMGWYNGPRGDIQAAH